MKEDNVDIPLDDEEFEETLEDLELEGKHEEKALKKELKFSEIEVGDDSESLEEKEEDANKFEDFEEFSEENKSNQ